MRPTARLTFAATLLAATVLGSVSQAALVSQKPTTPGIEEAMQVSRGDTETPDLHRTALAQFDHGDFRAAAESFREANARKMSLRAMLGRYLALGRIGENADGELQAAKSGLAFEQTTGLDYFVAEYFLGQRSLADLSAAARTIEDVCTVQFYKSEFELMQNRFEAAAEGLKSFADACPQTMTEYPSAVAELKRLDNDGYMRGLKAGRVSLNLKLVDRR